MWSCNKSKWVTAPLCFLASTVCFLSLAKDHPKRSMKARINCDAEDRLNSLCESNSCMVSVSLALYWAKPGVQRMKCQNLLRGMSGQINLYCPALYFEALFPSFHLLSNESSGWHLAYWTGGRTAPVKSVASVHQAAKRAVVIEALPFCSKRLPGKIFKKCHKVKKKISRENIHNFEMRIRWLNWWVDFSGKVNPKHASGLSCQWSGVFHCSGITLDVKDACLQFWRQICTRKLQAFTILSPSFLEQCASLLILTDGTQSWTTRQSIVPEFITC